MNKKLLTFTLIISLLGLNSCSSRQDEQRAKSLDSLQKSYKMVGGDVDEHGCKPSAGYTWSSLKNECIRIFEDGTRLNPIDTNLEQSLSAFVIQIADDKAVELFLPHSKSSIVLEKTKANTWVKDSLMLTKTKGLFELQEGNKTIYRQE